ncbi:hypothetical protein [Gordonia westfalica]|uniref:hypothetical protein n=1 Tax=Gordonia westfalica TaxID=158898 RepID=UPI0011139DCD|nr:hypothetical protein [Gordonia westfalica]
MRPIINGIFNGWFGGGSVGDPQEVQYTIQAIADAVLNGYNVETKVTSGTWTKLKNITELIVGLIGCGKNGSDGTSSTTTRAAGGLGGDTFSSNSTRISGFEYALRRWHEWQSVSFGTHITTTPGQGGISTSFGYSPTTSLPGTAAVVV